MGNCACFERSKKTEDRELCTYHGATSRDKGPHRVRDLTVPLEGKDLPAASGSYYEL